MPKVRFNLKSEQDPKLIMLILRLEGYKFQYSTGFKIDSKFWDTKKGRVKQSNLFPQYKKYNQFLTFLEQKTQESFLDFQMKYTGQDQRPTFEQLKAHLRNDLDKATLKDIRENEQYNLFGFIHKFISEREGSPEFAKGTVTIYRTTLKHLKEFDKGWSRKADFGNIDLDFAYDFKEYLYELNFSQNYIHKLIQQIRVFLNDATSRGFNSNMAFKSKHFQVKKIPVDSIYLNVDELKEMFYLDLSDNSRLDRARDLFILGSFTGLRFSDFSTLEKRNIKVKEGMKIIEVVTQKTKRPVMIPVYPPVQHIFDKYDGPPEAITNQKLNDYIKELAYLCNWAKDPVHFRISKGGKDYERRFDKAEKVSTHTARRSFATNAYLSGDLPTLSISKILGHKSEKQTLQYIKVSQFENAKILANSQLFKNAFLKAVR